MYVNIAQHSVQLCSWNIHDSMPIAFFLSKLVGSNTIMVCDGDIFYIFVCCIIYNKLNRSAAVRKARMYVKVNKLLHKHVPFYLFVTHSAFQTSDK